MKSGKLITLSYVSRATQEMGMLALMRLISQAVFHNKEIGATGVLFYENQQFGQILEGHESDILNLWEKIKQDPRHHEIKLIGIEEIKRRKFPQWSMRFFGADEIVNMNPDLQHVLQNLPTQHEELLSLMRTTSS